jgi:GNAT superfamily N-acetyltransferase
MSFVVFGLPRSRTRWLAEFLTYDGVECRHDSLAQAPSLKHLLAQLDNPAMGLVETGLMLGWQMVRARFPDCRFVVVRRPLDAVKDSLQRFGWAFEPGHLELMDAALDEIAEQPGTLSVDFAELEQEEICRLVFEHCLRRPFDRDHWAALAEQNIQIDMGQRLALLCDRRQEIENISQEIAVHCGSVTFQLEAWETFWRDGQDLFIAHHREAGPVEGMPFNPHEKAASTLDHMGVLQILTARCDGKMVGYLLFYIEPSLESKDVLLGIQSAFYVVPQQRGIGPMLHAFAVKHLKSMGVQRLILRAGVRGSGPKLASFFRRMGAEDNGRLFSLWIGEE